MNTNGFIHTTQNAPNDKYCSYCLLLAALARSHAVTTVDLKLQGNDLLLKGVSLYIMAFRE